MRETEEMQIRSLGREDLLEEGMATHSVLLPGEFPWTEEMGQVTVHGVARVGHNLATKPPPCFKCKPWFIMY